MSVADFASVGCFIEAFWDGIGDYMGLFVGVRASWSQPWAVPFRHQRARCAPRGGCARLPALRTSGFLVDTNSFAVMLDMLLAHWSHLMYLK